MKHVRIISIFTILFSIIFLNLNCGDNGIENTGSPSINSPQSIIKPENPTDGGTSDVGLYVQEYVQYSTDGGNTYTETVYQVAAFSGCNCFPLNGVHMEQGNFTTPAAGWRDIGGGQWIRSLSQPRYRIIYAASWYCQYPSSTVGLRWVVSGGMDEIEPMTGTCPTDPLYRTGSYYNVTPDITTWSNNQYHTVQYGLDAIVGCCGEDGD